MPWFGHGGDFLERQDAAAIADMRIQYVRRAMREHLRRTLDKTLRVYGMKIDG